MKKKLLEEYNDLLNILDEQAQVGAMTLLRARDIANTKEQAIKDCELDFIVEG